MGTNIGNGMSLEKCAQACADEVTCDSFEVFQPSGQGGCWIFDKNTKSEWISNKHANYYEMKAQYISTIDHFKDVRGAYCNGHPGGIKRSGYTLTSCSNACSADEKCTHFDWAPGKYNWCVLVTDGKACNTRNHGIWKHYEKKVLTQKFTKGANNGYWNVGKTNIGNGISLEKCAQACADEVTCDSFEVFQPSGQGGCWIFDKNTKSEWVSNE